MATSYSAAGSSIGGILLELLIFVVLPFGIVLFLFRRMARQTGSSLQGVMGVGKSRAKVFDAEQPKTKFSDVAGYDGVKAEISEVVDFLRSPERYQRAGAMAPRGVLMVGPPGTGKTLLARAVAGEASVPFFSVTGSSFVEMFVGVGAARVRDLFAEARKAAPAIIFIDEIDAIGQRRAGSGAVVANDEREQTLNQLLSEMDGFDVASGIVVLGATNRPEVLDPALLRPGRFDRQVVIPLPTLNERAAILAVHCRDKKLGPDVDLTVVARGTPGFSGADLANLANEAAIFAVREGRDVLDGRRLRERQGPDPARPPRGLQRPAPRGESGPWRFTRAGTPWSRHCRTMPSCLAAAKTPSREAKRCHSSEAPESCGGTMITCTWPGGTCRGPDAEDRQRVMHPPEPPLAPVRLEPLAVDHVPEPVFPSRGCCGA